MRIFIFYYEVFLQQEDNSIRIGVGGIQTYLYNLANSLSTMHVTSIVQYGNVTNSINYNKFDIRFYKSKNKSRSGSELFSFMEQHLKKNDLIIWGTDSIALNTSFKSILIQHGVAFDYYPEEKFIAQFLKKLGIDIFYRIFQQSRSYRFFKKSNYKVCVDYNYLNWFRVKSTSETKNIFVIPNFSNVNKSFEICEGEIIKIIFARRFVPKRGVLILIEVINTLLEKLNNIEFSIYGDGPLKPLLLKEFSNNSKVKIDKFSSSNSIEIHSKYDIALVPTIGSEGTSFSLLEAMGSGCACICSNVGGMTNIIIDGYNGFLVNPDSTSFCDKIELLVNDKNLRRRVRKNAHKTIKEGFSKEIWEKKWKDIIAQLH